jgi:hypothetical protein
MTPSPPPNNPVAALREAIRRVSQVATCLRARIMGATGIAVLLALSTWPVMNYGYPPPRPRWMLDLELAAGLIAPVVLGGFVVGSLLLVAFRCRRRTQLRQKLLRLPVEQRLAVLVPLSYRSSLGPEYWRDPHTRRLAESLLRDLHLTELTPAAAPEGRGDEASPAR